MPKVTIDGIEVEVPVGTTVLQACEAAGIEVPRFCYHDRLSIAGNCRMCLVQVEKAPPKPIASCAWPVADGMVVHTDTEMVRNAVANIGRKTGRSENEALAALVATNPQGRLIQPEEIAHAVLWLCSPGAEGITGQSIVLSGGAVN